MNIRRTVVFALGSLNLLVAACSSKVEGPGTGSSAGQVDHPGGGASATPGGGAPPASGGAPQFEVPPESNGGGMAAPPPPTDVTVIITADNAYGFGYGSDTQVLNYFGGIENSTSDDIFACPVGTGPETYTVPAAQANSGAYVYIIGYADKSTTQGVIAKFFREGADPVFTGTGAWQACATGLDYDPGMGGPTLEIINQQIAACNAGNTDPLTTSGGWVTTAASPRGRVAIGEDNSTDRVRPAPGNEFKIACDIDPAAHWMWYDWEPDRTTGSAFIWPGGTGNPTKDFLIFRLTADAIPQPVPK